MSRFWQWLAWRLPKALVQQCYLRHVCQGQKSFEIEFVTHPNCGCEVFESCESCRGGRINV